MFHVHKHEHKRAEQDRGKERERDTAMTFHLFLWSAWGNCGNPVKSGSQALVWIKKKADWQWKTITCHFLSLRSRFKPQLSAVCLSHPWGWFLHILHILCIVMEVCTMRTRHSDFLVTSNNTTISMSTDAQTVLAKCLCSWCYQGLDIIVAAGIVCVCVSEWVTLCELPSTW